MSQQETKEQEQKASLDSERESIISQLNALDGIEPAPAQASATPEAGERTPATEEQADPVTEQAAETSTEQGKDRKAKEADRLEKTWAEANRRKSELEAKERALAAKEAEVERLREEALQKQSTAGKFTPEDYEIAAKGFEEDGDTRNAEAARNMANQLRADIEAAKAKQHRQKYESDLREAVAKAKADHPDLNNPESPLAKAVNEVLTNRPEFMHSARGVADAVRVAELKLKADTVESVQKERDELKARLAEVEAKLHPGGSTPAKEATSKTFESMPLDEQRAFLLRAAMEADGSGDGMAVLQTQ